VGGALLADGECLRRWNRVGGHSLEFGGVIRFEAELGWSLYPLAHVVFILGNNNVEFLSEFNLCGDYVLVF